MVSPGLRFCNVDLHVHTPASHCYCEDGATPEEMVNAAISSGLNAIAITDHNTAEWVDRIMAAAQRTSLIVFPGVEITVAPGVHVLAIFQENQSGAHVTDLLSNLGLGADQRGNQDALVTKYGVQRVVSMIRDQNALPILAHVDGPRGAWYELHDHGQTLIQLWNAAEFAAIEITTKETPDFVGLPPYDHRPACFWASDNPHPDDSTKHSLLGIGSRYSRFKLDDPITWEGLRQCFHDPAVRIRPCSGDNCVPAAHPVLESVSVSGGFLSGLNIELNPNLNCIIGGRGTGKSALLETIRSAFALQPKTEVNKNQAESILKGTFLPGSEVSISFRLADGTLYRVKRKAGKEPLVFRDGESEPVDLSPADLLPLQIYGQKEIYEISHDASFQLRLLDNYVAEELSAVRLEETSLLRKLRENAEIITNTEDDVAKEEERLGDLGAVIEELRRMEQYKVVDRLKTKSLYDREGELIRNAQAQIDTLKGALDKFSSEHAIDYSSFGDESIHDLPNHVILLEQGQLLKSIDDNLKKVMQVFKTKVEKKWAQGQTSRSQWESSCAKQEKDYELLLLEYQGTGGTLNPERYTSLQRKKSSLEALQPSVKAKNDKIARYYIERQSLLSKLRSVRRRRFESRRAKSDILSNALNRDVRITVRPQGQRDVYKIYLNELFAGLNVRNPYRDRLADAEDSAPEQEPQRPQQINGETRYLVPRIPRYLDPIDLAQAIRAEQREGAETSLLENRFSIDSGAARRNMASLIRERLFELETYDVPDLPLFELRVAGGELGYRALDELSVGQKCTTILSMVLLESTVPLLIDQPEDDLDNEYIFNRIVDTLRQEKERRQFVIATHNANIPVSGDSELILVLEADDNRGRVREGCMASIDADLIKESVERILEGGQVAFQIRRAKYGLS